MKLKGRKLAGPYVRREPGTGVLSGPHAAVLSMTLGARLSPVFVPPCICFVLSKQPGFSTSPCKCPVYSASEYVSFLQVTA